jgi:hypothetical protein
MGFARPPERRLSPKEGVLLYRAWGGSSREWGGGYFSLEKPTSVIDAELRFNIADWGNEIHFVSTFRLKQGYLYFQGPVAHAKGDLSKQATQVWLESPFLAKIERIGTFETLKHDAFVLGRGGRA